MHLRAAMLILFLLSGLRAVSGQSDSIFKPYGKPVFLVFSNMHSSISKEGNAGAFEITRMYLGYEYFFGKSLFARANIDIGDPGVGGLHMTAYVKNAFLQYRTSRFSGRIGMISTDQFNLIEKQWGHRYIFKTLQDEYGFGPSADIGAAVEFSPAKLISFDASVLNGEGYKKHQSDSVFKYTFGMTMKPSEGLQLRVYTDFMKKEFTQKTVSLFAGYTCEGLSTGFEYSLQKNNKMISNHDFSGISAFASLKLPGKFSIMARYDQLWSATSSAETTRWNYAEDGQMFMAGLEFSPVLGVRIAPVFTGWRPANKANPFTSIPGFHFELRL